MYLEQQLNKYLQQQQQQQASAGGGQGIFTDSVQLPRSPREPSPLAGAPGLFTDSVQLSHSLSVSRELSPVVELVPPLTAHRPKQVTNYICHFPINGMLEFMKILPS